MATNPAPGPPQLEGTMTTLLPYTLLLVSSTAWAGLFSPQVSVNLVVPPPHVLQGVKVVAMGEFGGPQADKLRDYVQAGLIETARGSTEGFMVPDGLTTVVLKVGGTDAQAVLAGTVDRPDPVVEDYKNEVTHIQNGNKYTVVQSCRKRSVTVNFRVNVKDPTGTLLLQEEGSRTEKDSVCKDTAELLRKADAEGELASVDTLTTNALRPIGPWVANLVEPYRTTVTIDLLVDKLVRDGNKAARDGQWSEAIGAWKGVVDSDPYNAIAWYDLGVGYEVTEDFDKAAAAYAKSVSIDSKPEATQAVTRVAARKAQVDQLVAAYAMPFAPMAVSAVATAATPSGDQVTVAGGKNKRVPLRASPDEAADAVVQLPGGMSVAVEGTEGEYVKVRTVDGVEGYLLKKEVSGL